MPAAASEPPVELPIGYYRDNFAHVLGFVHQRYGDVLPASTRRYCDAFFSLDEPAQRMHVRLATRRGPLIRSDRAHYDEIPDPDRCWALLRDVGLLVIDPPVPVDDRLALLRKDELVDLLSEVCAAGPARSARKDELLLRAGVLEEDAVQRWIGARFKMLAPLGADALAVCLLCYFGNAWQDLSTFIRTDLGLVQYEAYDLDPRLRAFGSAAEIEAVAALSALSWTLFERERELGVSELLAIVAAADRRADGLAQPSVQRRAKGLRNRAARQLERVAGSNPVLLQQALAIYRRSESPPARERAARLLVKLGRPAEGLAVAEQIAAGPRGAQEQDFAATFIPRIRRKLGLSATSTARFAPRRTSLALTQQDGIGVEERVVQHLQAQGDVALHTENVLLPGIAGLALWDILFSPLPGAFLNPYQRGPIDLFSDDFYSARKHAIDGRVEAIASGRYGVEEVLETFRQKQGIANWLVPWQALDEPLLCLAIERMPATHVAAIVGHIAEDPRQRRSGLPDLAVFPAAGGYRLVEVKGPGDTLQPNQRRWLRFFANHAIPAEVCDVRWR